MEHSYYTEIRAGRSFESVQRRNRMDSEFHVRRCRSRLGGAVSFDGQDRSQKNSAVRHDTKDCQLDFDRLGKYYSAALRWQNTGRCWMWNYVRCDAYVLGGG